MCIRDSSYTSAIFVRTPKSQPRADWERMLENGGRKQCVMPGMPQIAPAALRSPEDGLKSDMQLADGAPGCTPGKR
eukprot:4476996-Amphidinium_carterae.2